MYISTMDKRTAIETAAKKLGSFTLKDLARELRISGLLPGVITDDIRGQVNALVKAGKIAKTGTNTKMASRNWLQPGMLKRTSNVYTFVA